MSGIYTDKKGLSHETRIECETANTRYATDLLVGQAALEADDREEALQIQKKQMASTGAHQQFERDLLYLQHDTPEGRKTYIIKRAYQQLTKLELFSAKGLEDKAVDAVNSLSASYEGRIVACKAKLDAHYENEKPYRVQIRETEKQLRKVEAELDSVETAIETELPPRVPKPSPHAIKGLMGFIRFCSTLAKYRKNERDRPKLKVASEVKYKPKRDLLQGSINQLAAEVERHKRALKAYRASDGAGAEDALVDQYNEVLEAYEKEAVALAATMALEAPAFRAWCKNVFAGAVSRFQDSFPSSLRIDIAGLTPEDLKPVLLEGAYWGGSNKDVFQSTVVEAMAPYLPSNLHTHDEEDEEKE
jgi:hypothetical protein